MAAVCSVCAEPFTNYMHEYAAALAGLLVACGGHHGHGTDAPGGDDAPIGDGNGSGSDSHTFATQSLIIPMDLAYQDKGMFQAYGLLFQLLRQGVPVAWVIDPKKTWHAAA